MKDQIKYSEIYSDVLATLGGDIASSFIYVPKKVVVRMWEKIYPDVVGQQHSKLEIIYDL